MDRIAKFGLVVILAVIIALLLNMQPELTSPALLVVTIGIAGLGMLCMICSGPKD